MSTGGYDPIEDMVKVKSVQKKWRDSFTGTDLNPGKWTQQLGSGASLGVAGGVLTMGSGVVAGAESWVLSTEVFTIPFRVSIALTLSQRIANQGFLVEAVSVNRETGQPDGQHAIALLFDGITPTSAKYEVQNGGLARLSSAAVTFPTSVSGSIYEIEAFADEAWFHGGALDAATGRANSYRRHQQIPDPNALYKVRLRWLNGATAPASNTNAVVQFLAVQDYAELTAEITAGRGQSAAGQSVAVNVVGMPAVSPIGGQARNTAGALPLLVATGEAHQAARRKGRGRTRPAAPAGAFCGGLGRRGREAAMSLREAALTALFARLNASLAARNPAPVIRRNETVPQRLPAGGLVVLRDGESVAETPILSPLAFAIEHRAEIEVLAADNALLDTLLVAIATAITADPMLSGAVEWAQPGSADIEDVEFEGAASARAASLPVALFFTATGSPLA